MAVRAWLAAHEPPLLCKGTILRAVPPPCLRLQPPTVACCWAGSHTTSYSYLCYIHALPAMPCGQVCDHHGANCGCRRSCIPRNVLAGLQGTGDGVV